MVSSPTQTRRHADTAVRAGRGCVDVVQPNAGGKLYPVGSFDAEASAVIAGSPAHVFDLFSDDANFFALRPSAVEHRDIEQLRGGGHSCVQVYEVGGRRIEQRSTCTVFERPHRRVDVGETAFGSVVITSTFEPTNDGTLVRLHQDTTRNGDIALLTTVVERARARRALRRTLGALDRLTASAFASPPSG